MFATQNRVTLLRRARRPLSVALALTASRSSSSTANPSSSSTVNRPSSSTANRPSSSSTAVNRSRSTVRSNNRRPERSRLKTFSSCSSSRSKTRLVTASVSFFREPPFSKAARLSFRAWVPAAVTIERALTLFCHLFYFHCDPAHAHTQGIQAFYPDPRQLEPIAHRVVQSGQIEHLAAQWRLPLEIAVDLAKLALFDCVIYLDDSGSMGELLSVFFLILVPFSRARARKLCTYRREVREGKTRADSSRAIPFPTLRRTAFEEGGTRIDDAKLIVSRVAQACSAFDDDGIQVRFMNSRVEVSAVSPRSPDLFTRDERMC